MISDMALIRRCREDLLTDEVPILFTGLNGNNDRVLGSFHKELPANRGERFIHTIVKSETFRKYRLRLLSYRQIIDDSREVFLVDRIHGTQERQIKPARISDLPAALLPGPNSFCPAEPRLSSDASFEAHMTGSHKSLAETVSAVLMSLNGVAKQAIAVLLGSPTNAGGGAAEIYAFPSGSFGIKFGVIPQQGDIERETQREKSNLIIGQYLQLATAGFATETDAISTAERQRAKMFYEMADGLSEIRGYDVLKEDRGRNSELEGIHSSLRRSAERIADIGDYMDDDFDALDVFSMESGDKGSQISSLTQPAVLEMRTAINEYDRRHGLVRKEQGLREHKITVYHLNTKTGHGDATLLGEDGLMHQVRLIVSTDRRLEGSDLTLSIHEGKTVPVRGRVTLVGNRPKELRIDLGPKPSRPMEGQGNLFSKKRHGIFIKKGPAQS